MGSHGFKRKNSAKKKYRPTSRPKIRWELLGLDHPEHTKPSIETIRSAVSTLAVTRLAREPIPEPPGTKKTSSASPMRKRR
jgi:hypothetical protein